MIKAATGCGLMSSMPITSAFLNLQATQVLAADGIPSDYKSLVCVFLSGGNDSFNMLAPKGSGTDGEYADYLAARGGVDNGGIALSDDPLDGGLLDIAGPSGRPFGVHPSLGIEVADLNSDATAGLGFKGLYDSGKVA
ncbi:MAG: hypothetical protein WBD31_07660, partial [Rubripirellula sp.]